MKLYPMLFIGFLLLGELWAAPKEGFLGKKMVDFQFSNLEGKLMDSDILRKDKVFYMKMGSLSCPMCTQMLGLMGQLDQEFTKLGVAFLDVSFDSDISALQAHAKENDVDFETLVDAENLLARWYGISGIPVSIIADAKGTILHYRVGLIPEQELRKMLEGALKIVSAPQE
jgi:peroxiredoxin